MFRKLGFYLQINVYHTLTSYEYNPPFDKQPYYDFLEFENDDLIISKLTYYS